MRRYIATAALGFVLVSAWMLIANTVRSRAGSSSASSLATIQRVVDAPSKSTYTASGDTKAMCGGRLVSSGIRVYHKAPWRHRIEYISGPLRGMVVVNDGEHTWRCDPHCGVVASSDTGSHRPGDMLRLMMRSHSVEQSAGGTVAGRPATVLVVRSKSGDIRKRLWLDGKTFIVLRSEEYSSDGKAMSSTAFKTIDYRAAVADSLFRQPGEMKCSRSEMSRDELSKAVGFQVVVPKYVPQGFKLDAYRLYNCPCRCGHKSAYIRYTNGMDSISVFETPANSGCMKMPACKMPGDRCCIHDQTATITTGGKSFIVIGDANPQELKRITDSLR